MKYDATVDVNKWNRFYYIIDDNTKEVWSRNRWGTQSSVPDLWASQRAAIRSLGRGKVARSISYGRKPIVKECIFGYDCTNIQKT